MKRMSGLSSASNKSWAVCNPVIFIWDQIMGEDDGTVNISFPAYEIRCSPLDDIHLG